MFKKKKRHRKLERGNDVEIHASCWNFNIKGLCPKVALLVTLQVEMS